MTVTMTRNQPIFKERWGKGGRGRNQAVSKTGNGLISENSSERILSSASDNIHTNPSSLSHGHAHQNRCFHMWIGSYGPHLGKEVGNPALDCADKTLINGRSRTFASSDNGR